jgi:hypothetical protein
MQFILGLPLFLFAGLIVVGVFWLEKSTHDDWVKDHPPVRYLQASQANRDPWRWRLPHPKKTQIPYQSSLPLGIKDAPEVSHFLFPKQVPLEFRNVTYSFLYLIGISLMGLGGVILLRTTGSDFGSRLLLSLVVGGSGFLILRSGPVVQIDLYPHRLAIVTQSAFVWRRTTFYERQQISTIRGRVQSPWLVAKGQLYPDYKITIARSLSNPIRVHQTFSLVCNPTTGSWVVGGLNHWKSLSL